MIVYVCGKYRGKNENEVFENIYLARSHALKLWKKGYAVICPHTNTMFMGCGDDDIFLKGDLELLSCCDYIYLLPNWKQSKGAREEVKWARKHKIKRLSIR